MTKKVLVVDDEESFLGLIKESLEMRGIEVVTATSAIEAGLALADHKPDLVLMDVKMPGINGIQACEAIKRNPQTKDIPIIIISALSDDADKKKAFKAGVLEYFVKPIDIENLVNKIKAVLGI